MPAYYRATLAQFAVADPITIVGHLQAKYGADGYLSQYSTQTRAWTELVPQLQDHLRRVIETTPESDSWSVLLEFPLYRLRKRIDIVILAGEGVIYDKIIQMMDACKAAGYSRVALSLIAGEA